jgi:hypothetical protein
MANGDITSIKELGRFTIPGAGHTLSGIARNNKVMCWGEIIGSYVSTGINLENEGGLHALGVTSADFISLTVTKTGAAGAILPTQQLGNLANIDAANKIFICDSVGADNPAVPTAGDIITIQYFVFGDDSSTPALV